MSRTKSAFLGTVTSQLFLLISMLINIVTTPFIVGTLKSEIYGLYIVIFQITGYLNQLDFGLGASLTRYMAGTRGESDEAKQTLQKVISTALVVYSIIGGTVAVFGIALSPLGLKIFDVPPAYHHVVPAIISVICVIVGCQFLLRSISGIFYAHQKQALFNTFGFILNISNIAFIVLFIKLGFDLWSFAYAQLIVLVLNVALNLYFFKKMYGYISLSYKAFDKALLKDMFSFGFFLFLNALAVQLVFQADRILVGSVISLTAVSIYSLTTKIPELSTGIIWKITESSFPGMVELANANDDHAFRTVHDKVMQLSLSASSVFMWFLLLITYPFLKLWVGPQYYGGTLFLLLALYLYLIHHTFIHVTAVALNGAGFVKGFSLMSVFEALLNVGISIWLSKIYGITGVIMGTIIAGTLTSVWYIPYVAIKHKSFKVSTYILSVAKPVAVCSLFGGVLYLLFNGLFKKIDSWPALILYSALAGLILIIPFVILNIDILKGLKKKVLDQ